MKKRIQLLVTEEVDARMKRLCLLTGIKPPEAFEKMLGIAEVIFKKRMDRIDAMEKKRLKEEEEDFEGHDFE